MTKMCPLKWWGGKSYLADWIISLMPKHLHYVEPYAGGLAVLLDNKLSNDRLPVIESVWTNF